MPLREIVRAAVDASYAYREKFLFNAAANVAISALTYGALRNVGELARFAGYDSAELNTIGDMLAPLVSAAVLSYGFDNGPLPPTRFRRDIGRGMRDLATIAAAGVAGYVAASDLMDYNGSDQTFQFVRNAYYNITLKHPEAVSALIGLLGRAYPLIKRYGRERNAEIRAARAPWLNPRPHH